MFYKSANEICEEMLEQLNDTYAKDKGTWVWEILKAAACGLSEITEKLDELKDKLFVEGCSGDDLDDYVENWSYIERKKNTQAVGWAEFKAGESGGEIPQGTYISTEDKVYYLTTEAAEVAAGGRVTVPIAAEVYGSNGNCEAGEICVLVSNVAFIEEVVNREAVTGGQDEESDEELRARFFEAMKKNANAGNKAFYVEKAKTVDGVSKAYCVPCENGAGTVSVYCLNVDGEPVTESVRAAVQNLLDPNENGDGSGEAPIGAVCSVKVPDVFEVIVSFDGFFEEGYSEEEVKDNVGKAISEYLGECFETGLVRYNKMIQVIMEADGIKDMENLFINNRTGNLEIYSVAVFRLSRLFIN